MAWYVYLAHFGAGLFLANGVPHFVNGISGKRFQTPFASPPGVGKSSPPANVIWGTINFIIAYVLIFVVGTSVAAFSLNALLFGLGGFVAAIGLAWHFGRLNAKN